MAGDRGLGTYLKDRRARLDPATFGFPADRRRTPGLRRRSEVAQRANISPTWYTWLEQGRGGAPSADVLDRLAHALMLTDLEREHLFLLGLGRPPEARYRRDERHAAAPACSRSPGALSRPHSNRHLGRGRVEPRGHGPAGRLRNRPPRERNLLRRLFLDPQARAAHQEWESVARFVISAFRVDAARAGAAAEVEPLVDELCRLSPEFQGDVGGERGPQPRRGGQAHPPSRPGPHRLRILDLRRRRTLGP